MSRHLPSAEERLRMVVGHAPIILFAIDASGVLTLSEGSGLAALGLAPGEAVGRSAFELYADQPGVVANLRRALAGETFTDVQAVQGQTFETRFTPFLDDEGRVAGVIGVATDISARARIEEGHSFLTEVGALLGSSLEYDATLSTLAGLLSPRMADWAVIYVREEDKIRRVGVAHADAAKLLLLEQFHARYSDGILASSPVLFALQTGQSLWSNDISDEALRLGSYDEEDFHFMRHTLGVRSALVVPMICRGRTLGAICLQMSDSGRRYDEGDLALAEGLARLAATAVDNSMLYKKAQEAVRERDEFMSIASHEIRTPLSTLVLQLQMLTRIFHTDKLSGIDAEKLVKRFDGCERQVKKLWRLIDMLLDVSRIGSGQFEVHREEVDLSGLARDVLARFADEIAEGGYKVELHAPAPLCGRWDRLRLEQVLTNLLSNAMRYGAGKPISISVEADGADPALARLIVQDHGIGIDPAHHARIFRRFERVRSENVGLGLGLGLHIVQQIVAALGGKVDLVSAPSQGSTFTVSLPVDVPLPAQPL